MIDLEQIIENVVRRVVREEIAAALKPRGELVTIAVYAAARTISPATVRAAIKAGRLGCVKNGRAWRVRADEEIADGRPTEEEGAFALRLIGGGK